MKKKVILRQPLTGQFNVHMYNIGKAAMAFVAEIMEKFNYGGKELILVAKQFLLNNSY